MQYLPTPIRCSISYCPETTPYAKLSETYPFSPFFIVLLYHGKLFIIVKRCYIRSRNEKRNHERWLGRGRHGLLQRNCLELACVCMVIIVKSLLAILRMQESAQYGCDESERSLRGHHGTERKWRVEGAGTNRDRRKQLEVRVYGFDDV